MSIDANSIDLLRKDLAENYVPLLPALIPNTKNADEQHKKNVSRALSAFALRHYCNVTPKEAAQSVVDDFNDEGIDGILYHGDVLYIVQSKLKESKMFEQEEAQALCSGLRKLLAANFSGFNAHVTTRQTEIEGALENCSKIQILIAHVGSGISQHAHDVIHNFLNDDALDEERLAPTYQSIDANQITNYLRNGNAYERVDAKIWLECYKSIGSPRTSYFGLVSLQDLVALHKKHQNGLYEKNIRTFLGMGLKQGVNDAIQETLKTNPQDFCYLNNGVTALCETIEPKSAKQGKKLLRLSGLSVINGAQTISSSSYAAEKGVDISAAKVMLTIIKADTDTEFGKSVTKARNHQNPVSLADFVALEEDQERLRREAAYLKIQYDYKPGAPEALFDPDRINIAEALFALALTHEDPRYAVWLKKEPNSLFVTKSDAYKGIFNADLKIHTLVNAVRFYRVVQELAAEAGRRCSAARIHQGGAGNLCA